MGINLALYRLNAFNVNISLRIDNMLAGLWFISRQANDRRIKDLHPSIRSIDAPPLTWTLTSQRRIMIAFKAYDSFSRLVENVQRQIKTFFIAWPVDQNEKIGNPHKLLLK